MRAARSRGTVGIVGLGIMGGAFARNLLAAGWRVIGYDVEPARRRAIAKAGGEIARDAAQVGQVARILITSLPHPSALTTTVDAILRARVRPLVIVETSTFTLPDKLAAARALEAAGHTLLDCPISGTGAQARTGDIVVYASGERKIIRQLRPLFQGFARAAHDLGTFGNGSRMKYVANLLVAINNVAAAEAMVLGMKAGLEPRTIYDMVRTGVGNTRIFELRAPMMVKRHYADATMKVSVWRKDMRVIGDFAKALACPTPLFSACAPIYEAALKAGHADDDTASVCAVLEAKARLRRGARKPASAGSARRSR